MQTYYMISLSLSRPIVLYNRLSNTIIAVYTNLFMYSFTIVLQRCIWECWIIHLGDERETFKFLSADSISACQTRASYIPSLGYPRIVYRWINCSSTAEFYSFAKRTAEIVFNFIDQDMSLPYWWELNSYVQDI